MSTTLMKAPSHAHPSTELEALTATYRERGFVNAGALLDQATVEHLRTELDRVIAQREIPGVPQAYRTTIMGSEASPIWQIVDIWMASAGFAALLRSTRLLSVAAALSGARELRLWHDQIQYKPAGIGGVNWWHQDWPYWRAVAPADALVTAWIALDDVDTDNGCMSMVPGSHRYGDTIEALHACKDERQDHDVTSFSGALPPRFRDLDVRPEPCRVKAGHVHFHHPYTWHGSHANRGGRPRRAIAIHMMTENAVHRTDARHLKSPDIAVPDGAPVEGPLFPLMWKAGWTLR